MWNKRVIGCKIFSSDVRYIVSRPKRVGEGTVKPIIWQIIKIIIIIINLLLKKAENNTFYRFNKLQVRKLKEGRVGVGAGL